MDNPIIDYLAGSNADEKENASNLRSAAGLNASLIGREVRSFWLDWVLDKPFSDWHREGRIHIHDLSSGLRPYCLGLDFEALLLSGFGGVTGQPESTPPRHMRTAIDQLVNWFGCLSQEAAGALAVSNFDTYLAPFVRADNMSNEDIYRCCESLVYALNVCSRFGGQSMFSNINVSGYVPKSMQDRAVVLGGDYTGETYGEYEEETERVAVALLKVLLAGQPDGKPWTFPIISVGITEDYAWDSLFANLLCELSAKYGTPNFLNYGPNSPYSEDDTLASCCRLATDTSRLRSSGGLFSVNPNTGSVSVMTISLPYLAALAKDDVSEFLGLLRETTREVCQGLKRRRKFLTDCLDAGLFPYWKAWVGDFQNHFSTVGLLGGEEASRILCGGGMASSTGQWLRDRILDTVLETCSEMEAETDQLINVEQVPAEGACYSLAEKFVSAFPQYAYLFGEDEPYLTNGLKVSERTLPTSFDRWIDLHENEAPRYTGGSAMHWRVNHEISPAEIKTLVSRTFARSAIPHLTINPLYQICPEHGRLSGHSDTCPKCGAETLKAVRVLGYYRYTTNLNPGKAAEYRDYMKRLERG